MFNWFRRQFQKEENPQTEPTPVETPVEPTPTVEETDYLTWAKQAYQNIQTRHEPLLEEPQTAETELEDTLSETIETPPENALIAEPEATVKSPETPPIKETEPNSSQSPSWMQKTTGLEKLKETAIEEEVKLDEDFLWSAQVLAEQGRRPDEISADEINWLKKLREGLDKTRRGMINQLKAIVGQGPLNDSAVTEIESLLLQADVGISATEWIIETLQEKLRQESLPPEQAIEYLKSILQDLLDRPLKTLPHNELTPEPGKLNIWLLTGVNGVGKTTTIGKLAHLATSSGYSCVIAAADTFRAAAVEQVKVWGERSNTPVIANPGQNTDPASVVFDAITSAQSRNADVLLVDTAGRLQNKKNLMDELAKIRKIIDKKAPNAKIESLLVLDATLGQNGLRQAEVFSASAQLSGVILTKLDGTAKGGVALAVVQQLNLPIRFIGAGEGISDLRPFSSYEFVSALLNG